MVIGGAPSEFQKPAIACSDEAMADGAAVGMTMRQIQARCPDAVVLPPDPEGDAAAFEPFLTILDQFSPVVAASEPGLAYCDVANLEPIFGPDEELAEAILTAVKTATGVDAYLGIAENRFAARMVAYAQAREGVKAAVASSTQPLPVSALLAPLSIDLLPGLTPDTLDRLRFLGIHTLGQFAALSRNAVMTRFGQAAGVAHELASGIDRTPLLPRVQPVQLSERAPFEELEPRLDRLLFSLRRLMTRLEARLLQSGLLCRTLEVTLELEQTEPWRFVVNVSQPSASAKQLTDVVRWQLEKRKLADLLHSRKGVRERDGTSLALSQQSWTTITALVICVTDAVPQADLQLSLFGSSRAQSRQVAMAIDRLCALLGPEAVRRATLAVGQSLRSRRPERAFWFELYRPPDPKSEAFHPSPPDTPVPVLRFLDPPRGITVRMHTNVPATLHMHQRRERVVACAGPWRLAEGWWGERGQARLSSLQTSLRPDPAIPLSWSEVARDYYQVLTNEQTAYLIFRDLTIDRWYVQGIFD